VVITVLTGGFAGIWWASYVNAKVDALGARMDERFKASDARLDEKFKANDARLDRLDAAITKLIEQGRSSQGATKNGATS